MIDFAEFKSWMGANDVRTPGQIKPAGDEDKDGLVILNKIKESVSLLGVDLAEFFSKFGKANKDQCDYE